jgi:hypothetical protein
MSRSMEKGIGILSRSTQGSSDVEKAAVCDGRIIYDQI